MKKTIHLGICLILMFLYIYLTPLGAITLARTFGLGMDSYIIFLVGEVLLIFFLFVLWLKKKKMLFIFEKKGWRWSYLAFLVACFLIYSFLNGFRMQNIRLIDHSFIFQDLLSELYLNGRETTLSSLVFLIFNISIVPVVEETIYRGYFMNTFFPQSKYYLDVILSALIFGLSHLILTHRDPISLIIYSLGGLFYALVYRWTRNLKITILCHSFFNFLIYAKPIWIFVYNYVYYHFFR
ncbi:lysostaphin resistance A-like protein [Streptococcus sp. HJ1]|uniref:lysostaphin resistance A-like protein n=1 Tax=Streptococcus sp. HJ1 TaxID=3458239 RepID=UPI004038199B